MDDLTISGNPGWIDTDACNGTLSLVEIAHGASVASITLEMESFDGEPRVEAGVELTAGECRALMERLALILAGAPMDA